MIVGCSEYIFLDRQRHRAQDSFRKIGRAETKLTNITLEGSHTMVGNIISS